MLIKKNAKGESLIKYKLFSLPELAHICIVNVLTINMEKYADNNVLLALFLTQ